MSVSRISSWVVALLIVGLYVYATVAAIGNLIGMGTFLGGALGPLPWTLLGLGVAVPPAALVIALLLGRGRGAGARILLLAAGLCATAAIQLEILHLSS